MTLLSVFGGFLWVIPVGLLLAGLYSLSRAYRASKSGSKKQGGADGGNLPIYKTGAPFWFGVVLVAAAVFAFISMLSDK